MNRRFLYELLSLIVVWMVVVSCSMSGRIAKSDRVASLSQTAKKEIPKPPRIDTTRDGVGSNVTVVRTDSTVSYITDVELDEEGAAMSVVTIDEIVVTSTLKSIPERFGFITIDFKVSVPKEYEHRRWSVILTPVLHRGDTILRLDPVVLRGQKMDTYQERSKWRYDKYCTTLQNVAATREQAVGQHYDMYTSRVNFYADKYTVEDSVVARRQAYAPFYSDRARYKERVELFADKYQVLEQQKKSEGRGLSMWAIEHSSKRADFFDDKYALENKTEQRMKSAPRYGFGDSYKLRSRMFADKYSPSREVLPREEFIIAPGDTMFTAKAERAREHFILNPRHSQAKMDSVVVGRRDITYHYKQDIQTNENTNRLKLTIDGYLGNMYADQKISLPSKDTLTYTVSSMISFIDTATRYVYNIISKYATVNDRSWITFPIGKSTLIDSLGDNRTELEKMKTLMSSLLYQYEFYVDSVILTAASSPDGNHTRNEQLSMQRAQSLRNFLVKEFDQQIDTLITVRWIGEDWKRLTQLVLTDRNIENRAQIVEIINQTPQPDRRDALIAAKYKEDFAYIKNTLYPQLRSVSFKYDLRRVGMVQDTVYTTEVDTVYKRGVELLTKRKYHEALGILTYYKDLNTAITLMSLGYDKDAFEMMLETPQTPHRDYMLAVLCARLKRPKLGMEYFRAACAAQPSLEFRGNLDPEVQFLLKSYNK